MPEETTDYRSVATEIIKETIASAIFIDDKVFNFHEIEGRDFKEDSLNVCKKLYSDFANQDCSLDFYKYEGLDSFKKKEKLLLERKDLLVLDWELNQNVIPFKDTLKIIDKAVNTPNLHFICIYTQEDKTKFPEILLNILCYFYGDMKEDKEKIEEILDEAGVSGVERTEFKDKCKELFLANGENKDAIKKDIFKNFNFLNCNTYKQLNLSNGFVNKIDNESLIGLILDANDEFPSKDNNKKYYFSVDSEKYYIQINNTMIAIFNKKATSEELFTKFAEAISSIKENVFTLMALEIKSFIIKNSSFMGKELGNLNKETLFYHLKSFDGNEGELKSFFIEQWYKYNINEVYMESFKLMPHILNEVNAYTNKPDDDALMLLNYKYNINPLINKNNKIVIFGDIFHGFDDCEHPYLLCITPLCDCVRPEKICNDFLFVKGKKVDNHNALKNAEKGFYSFIKHQNEFIAVEWRCKPFTVRIPSNSIEQSNKIVGRYIDKELPLEYVSSIKENYAQRIANNTFSDSIRVGSSFAQINKR